MAHWQRHYAIYLYYQTRNSEKYYHDHWFNYSFLLASEANGKIEANL